MLRRTRLVILVLLAAVGGAIAGRLAAEARRKQEAGEDPTDIDVRRVVLRPQDLIPGVVAAMRVRDRPWSWLRIPSWVAAFAVNWGVAAFGGDLQRLREMAERSAFGDDALDATVAEAPGSPNGYATTTTWTSENAPTPVPGDDPPGGLHTGFTPY